MWGKLWGKAKCANGKIESVRGAQGRTGEVPSGRRSDAAGATVRLAELVPARDGRRPADRYRDRRLSDVGLAAARATAVRNRAQALDGIDPRGERRQRRSVERPASKAPSLREAAAATFTAHSARWGTKTCQAWASMLSRYVFDLGFGGRPIDEIGRADVLRVLSGVWVSKPVTGKKLKSHLRAIFAWALASGHVDINMVDAVSGALPRQPTSTAHHAAMPHQEVGAALVVIEAADAPATAKLALRFAIVTATRSDETRGARWDEVNVEGREWTIPASRMKAKREHRVPLSDAAVRVLAEAEQYRGRTDLVFPSLGRPGRQQSDVALARVLRVTGLSDRASVHGFRSSFRDWASEMGEPYEVAEQALAHVVGGVTERSYARSDLFDKRRELMDAWASYIA